MYRINKDENIIEELKVDTFKNLGFKERKHL